MSRDQQEWENQYGYERFVHDCISREKSAYSRGEKKGIQQGIQLGASQKAIEDALNALKMNLSVEQVCKITNLTLEKVKELAEQLRIHNA